MISSVLDLPATYTRRLLQRGVMFWLLTRCALATMMASAKAPPLPTSAGNIIAITIVVAFLSLLETGLRRERLFNANLGVAAEWFVVLPAATAVVCDVILTAALRFAHAS